MTIDARLEKLEYNVEELRRVQVYHASKLTALEDSKPWFFSKGVIGPLVSGAATIAMVVGYIQNWPADAMAILAAVAGGGSITGVIGRATATKRVG